MLVFCFICWNVCSQTSHAATVWSLQPAKHWSSLLKETVRQPQWDSDLFHRQSSLFLHLITNISPFSLPTFVLVSFMPTPFWSLSLTGKVLDKSGLQSAVNCHKIKVCLNPGMAVSCLLPHTHFTATGKKKRKKRKKKQAPYSKHIYWFNEDILSKHQRATENIYTNPHPSIFSFFQIKHSADSLFVSLGAKEL